MDIQKTQNRLWFRVKIPLQNESEMLRTPIMFPQTRKKPIDPEDLVQRVSDGLNRDGSVLHAIRSVDRMNTVPSVVLFLLSPKGDQESGRGEPSLVLTKRSQRVRQPGDLCCPGGGIASGLDTAVGWMLRLPGTPLTRWPGWKRWRSRHPEATRQLATFLAAGLREGIEEMRLNPFGVRFLGALPSQELVMFRRIILPLVGWLPRQRRFLPNWEVERLVSIPLGEMLSPRSYACYRLTFEPGRDGSPRSQTMDFPCFVHNDQDQQEILWGATYRITAAFLKQVFDFSPPPADALPVIRSRLSRDYSTGNRK